MLKRKDNAENRNLSGGKEQKPKLLNRNYLLLMLVSLITSMGYSMIATLIAPYGVNLGAGLTAAGALAGIYSLSALVVRPFGGYAADRINKRSMCLLATGMICLCMVGYAVSPGIGMLFAVRIVHGAAFGISGTANLALVYEFVPEERLSEGLGYFGLGQIISQVCGPSMGMAVKDWLGYRPLFLIIAVMTIGAVLVLLLIKTVSVHKKESSEQNKFRLKNLVAKECIVYALVGGVFSLGNGIVSSFLVLLGEERSIPGIALFFSVNAVVIFVLRLFVGKIVDRTGLSLVVNLSLVLGTISMVLIGWGWALWIILLAAVLKAIGQGGAQISLQAACIKKVDPGRVGIAVSTYFIGADIGQGLGPIVGGKISTIFNYEVMFYCVAGITAAALVLFNLYQKKTNVGSPKMLAAEGEE